MGKQGGWFLLQNVMDSDGVEWIEVLNSLEPRKMIRYKVYLINSNNGALGQHRVTYKSKDREGE